MAGIARSGAIGSSTHAEVSRAIRTLLADPDGLGPHARRWPPSASLKDREAIPALLAAAQSGDCAVRGRDGTRRGARHPRLAGLSPRPGRQEPRPAPGLGDRDRQHPRQGRAGARPARDAATSCRRRSCPSCKPSTPAWRPITAWQVVGPFPIAAGPGISPEKPIDTSASYEGAGGKQAAWRSVELADKQGQVDLGPHLQPRRRPGGLRLRRDREPLGPHRADGRRVGRHADRLAQRQGGLSVRGPPRLRSRGRPGSTSPCARGPTAC